jgi:hypothetical protein
MSAIPNTYTDLKLLVSARFDGATIGDFAIQFNGDTTSNYSYVEVYGQGTGNTGAGGGAASRHNSIISGTAVTANTPNSVEISIIDYKSSSRPKLSSVESVLENMSASTNVQMRFQGWKWNSNSPITSIRIFDPAGTKFVENSNIYLYGISND